METSLVESTELGIRLALGIDEVDHLTAEVGLAGLDAEFSLPAAAAVGVGVRREAEEDLGVSARGAGAVAVAAAAFPPLPPPRSLRRVAIGWARVWAVRGRRGLGEIGRAHV